jgi:pimeloyl-ACP methyl ester carboxylesterase
MKRKAFLSFTIVATLFFTACKPEVKSGYVEVPTVTENALSSVYTLSPKHSKSKLYYEEAGQGETIILLHAKAVDCRMWDDVYFKLARKYHVIRYDMRGYGKSDFPEIGLGYLHADDLKNLMDALDIEQANLVGLSMGGNALADFIALYPERVKTATLTSGAMTNYPDRSSAPKWAVKIYNDTVFTVQCQEVKKNMKIGLAKLKDNRKKAMKSVSGKHYQSIKKDLNKMIDDWQGWQLLHPETDAFIGDQADSLISKQKVHPPLLFLIGRYDYEDSKRSMQRMASLCPGSRIQIMSEAGHFTAMECPKEFVEHLEAFIEKNSSGNRNVIR